jgi:sulfite exporter TauE/SafE/plastocyanin domain-containing protein/copper chaperone CopZ
MLQELKIKIENIKSTKDKLTIEAEIEVLDGVDGVSLNHESGNCHIKFDGDKISEEQILEKIRSLDFIIAKVQVQQKNNDMPIKEHTYSVKGMHCASCEILIEKKLLQFPEVKSVEASTNKGEVLIEFQGNRPNPHRLNKIFDEEKYTFFDKTKDFNKAKQAVEEPSSGENKANPTLIAFNIAIFIIIAFLMLNKMGIANFLSISSTSSLIAFLGFGLLAGFSSCAALVGGIVLSMSKQWQSLYSGNESTSQKLQPHIMFNVGRVVSYTLLGGVLGIIGNKLQISPQFTAFLIIAISFLMVAFGMQMLGVKAFRKFQFTLPKSFTRYIADERNFQGKQMPAIMGALTFFLPCGFTITAQSLALLSGNPVQGALMMGTFALGTAPSLLFIGLSSVKLSSKPHLAERFSKVAGFLVLFFALFNFNNQMTVLGFSGISNILPFGQAGSVSVKDLPQIIDGKQVIKMTAYGSKDVPNYFKVRVGIPVRWEITADRTAGGCNGSIISNSLFSGSIDLVPGQLSVKEFTPTKTGKFRFSCQMGMISGVIEVIDVSASATGSQVAEAATDPAPAPSGGTCGAGGGCGCGGGSANVKKDTVATNANVVGDTQVIKSTYTASNYLSPNLFKVKAGTKVRLEIDVKDSGRGCGSAIKIPGLYDNAISLTAGNTINMEFTPTTAGSYNITCGMNMIRFGSILVE